MTDNEPIVGGPVEREFVPTEPIKLAREIPFETPGVHLPKSAVVICTPLRAPRRPSESPASPMWTASLYPASPLRDPSRSLESAYPSAAQARAERAPIQGHPCGF